jgi:hypothetical protein
MSQWTTGDRRYRTISCRAVPVLLLSLSAGCFSGHATYPEGWAAPATAPPTSATAARQEASHDCPNLAGRYVNAGQLAPDTPRELCESATTSKFRMIGDWFCESSLSMNIAGLGASNSWLELRQPDGDTLVAVSGDPAVPTRELHRSKGDFECTQEGLTRVLRAPMTSFGYEEGDENTATKAYNVFAAVELAFIATGGAQTLKRTFSRLSDGSLVMRVVRSTHGLMVGLPLNYDYSTYVSWAQDASAAATPEGATPAPSTLVARLRPFKAHAFASVWLVSVDGKEISTDELLGRLTMDHGPAEFWDVPQVAEPGPHWLEFYRWGGPRVRYGSVVDLQAGHTYTLAQSPPECDAGSKEPGSAPSHSLSWRDLVIEDTMPGSPAVRTRVRAMCGFAVNRCQQDTECGGEKCMRHPGNDWGFCGTSAPY